jgi:hypothetical protein
LLQIAKIKNVDLDPEAGGGWFGKINVREAVVLALLKSKTKEVIEFMAQVVFDRTLSVRIRENIIKYLYIQKHPVVVKYVIENFAEYYSNLFEMPGITKKLIKELKVKLPTLKDKNLNYAKAYLLNHSINSVDSIINELKKKIVLIETFCFFY